MKNLLYFLLIIGISFLSFQSKAAHLSGCDISYKSTSTAQVYLVTVKVYGACPNSTICNNCSLTIPYRFYGCSLSVTKIGLSPGFLGVNFGNVSLPAISTNNAYDIVKTCSSVSTICNNCNTRNAGTYSPALEVYVFEGLVDLTGISSAGCKIGIQYSDAFRNAAATTFNSGVGFSEMIEIDMCQTQFNSAPVFANVPIINICAFADFSYNLGAFDIDGDSLSYEFGENYDGFNLPVTYNVPYSKSYPFPYFGAPNANAAYPAGLRIDPITGDIKFRPMGAFVSTLVIEVTQWKLIGGIRVNVGKTRRDVMLFCQLCSNVKTPRIKIYKNNSLTNNQTFVAYPNQAICLDIVAEDQEDLTSSPPVLADSTDLKWNNPSMYDSAMLSATFIRNYVLGARVKADSFKFCWTPPFSSLGGSHNITFNGFDNNCPVKNSIFKGINIEVQLPKIFIDSIQTKKVFCNSSTTITDVFYNTLGIDLLPNNLFTVQLSNASGFFTNPITLSSAVSNNVSGSIAVTIPLGLTASQLYKIRILNTSSTINEIIPMTISIIAGIPSITISSNKNSFCKGRGLAVISVTPNSGNYTYKWLRNTEIIGGANNNNYNTDSASNYRVLVSNAGCSDTSNSLALVVNPKPKAEFVCLDTLCKSELFNFIIITNNSYINSGTIGANWIFSDGTTDNVANPVKTIINNNNLTIKLVITSNNNCADSTSKTVVINQKPTINFTINDSLQCFKNNSFIFTKTITNANLFDWKFGDSTTSNISNPTKSYSKTGTFLVRLFAQNNNGCSDSFSKTVTIYNNANANFTINNAVQCLSGNIFSFTNLSDNFNTQIWSFGDTNHSTVLSPTKTYNNAGVFSVKLVVNDSNNCPDSLVKMITIYPKPNIGNITGNTTTNAIGIPLPYSVSSQTNTIYNWAATNGTIQSGQGTNSVNVIWPSIGTGSLKANITNSNGCTDSTNLAINITNVSVNNLSLENDLKVYPNPTKTSITIINKTNLVGKKYIITNLVGQTVLSGKLNLDETIVNLENLQSGIYLLSIDGLNKQSIKVMKE